MTMKFEDNSAQVKGQLNSTIDRALTKVGEIVKGQIVKNTPVDTGGLRNSVDYQKTVKGMQSVIEIGSTKAYAPYVEYGTGEFATNGSGRRGGWWFKDSQGHWWFTRGQHASHYMRNSFQQTEKRAATVIQNELGGMK